MVISRDICKALYLNGMLLLLLCLLIGNLSGFDPCQDGMNRCHEKANCTTSGDSFTCTCTTGFSGNGYDCVDLNECEIGLNNCSENASCYNVPGSFQCQCNQGFVGDGRICTLEMLAPDLENSTCLEGSDTCHSTASCVDYPNGFCCKCISPNFGNGIQCIAPGQPQRMIGKVSGSLNGINFHNLDMHAFVITKDGLANVVINRVPLEIGSYILTLNMIGGVVGWMFAVQEGDKAMNGYTYTGGNFSGVAQIKYRAGGEVTITQTFFGYDALNNIIMETHIDGTVPDMGEKLVSITVDDYQEEYKRVSPGIIKSFSERTYSIDSDAYMYTWNQTITFEECTADPGLDREDTMRLSVSKNFLSFDSNVIRFNMSNKIAVHTGFDPCQDDMNTCHENADCTPSGDTFTCSCRTGFVGDGYNCEANIQHCGDAICSEFARCVYNSDEEQGMCECRSGYMGNGTSCTTIVFECNEIGNCADNAECIYSSQEGRYVCECMEESSGDGENCERYKRLPECMCAPNSDCILQPEFDYRCVCGEGYTGDGVNYCTAINESLVDCDQCHSDAFCLNGYMASQLLIDCRCNPGYIGDGFNCQPVDCKKENVCDSNARCVKGIDDRTYCQCNSGYEGNGYRCEVAGCNVVNNCAIEADCLVDPRDSSRYICTCRAGYTGDGYVCLSREVSCNVVNNCGQNAECVHDPEALSYRCRCEQGFEGDGFTCLARGTDCRSHPSLCDSNASCIINVDRFECVCNPNYRRFGTACVPIEDGNYYLLFSRGYSLHKIKPYNLNGEDKDGTRVAYVPDEIAIGVADDCATQQFYWTDVSKGQVSRASIDGLDQEVVAQGFKSPQGIAIDYLSRTMYVTDSQLDIIAVANLKGTYKKTLISDSLDDPRAIVLDPQRGVMYWTDWYRENPTIEQANMDGSDRKVFVDLDLELPNGLTMDPYTQQICWGDAGMKRIECIRSDGVGRRIITEDAPYPFDVTMYGGNIYWSDWTIHGVPSVDFNGGEVKDALPLPTGGNGRLYGITSVGEFCPPVINACYRSNGGCRYLCLPTPNGGRTCACPDDIDEVTCSEIAYAKKRK